MANTKYKDQLYNIVFNMVEMFFRKFNACSSVTVIYTPIHGNQHKLRPVFYP